jgi:catechol 2,3-dioxygenase-like lactoylglutathione lyase family enzyme
MDRSLEFYGDLLGFVVDWSHQFEPGLPRFVSISRDGITLFLTEHPETSFETLVYLFVDDVDRLAEEIQQRGGRLDLGPVDQSWEMREFHLDDPDGNRLRFGTSRPAGKSKG